MRLLLYPLIFRITVICFLSNVFVALSIFDVQSIHPTATPGVAVGINVRARQCLALTCLLFICKLTYAVGLGRDKRKNDNAMAQTDILE